MVIKTLHWVKPLTVVSAFKVHVFLVKFILKEAQNLNIVTTLFSGTQQRGRVFMTSFAPKDFIQMDSKKPSSTAYGFQTLK